MRGPLPPTTLQVVAPTGVPTINVDTVLHVAGNSGWGILITVGTNAVVPGRALATEPAMEITAHLRMSIAAAKNLHDELADTIRKMTALTDA